jgi:hypothetical protein
MPEGTQGDFRPVRVHFNGSGVFRPMAKEG